MSIREKLAGLGSAVKEKVGAAFGDPALSPEAKEAAAELEAELASKASMAPPSPGVTGVTAAMDEGTARGVLGLTANATLDEVRAAAARLSHPAVAGAATNDDVAQAALDRIATAAELLEERLLPLAGSPSGGPTGSGEAPSGGRVRATARR